MVRLAKGDAVDVVQGASVVLKCTGAGIPEVVAMDVGRAVVV